MRTLNLISCIVASLLMRVELSVIVHPTTDVYSTPEYGYNLPGTTPIIMPSSTMQWNERTFDNAVDTEIENFEFGVVDEVEGIGYETYNEELADSFTGESVFGQEYGDPSYMEQMNQWEVSDSDNPFVPDVEMVIDEPVEAVTLTETENLIISPNLAVTPYTSGGITAASWYPANRPFVTGVPTFQPPFSSYPLGQSYLSGDVLAQPLTSGYAMAQPLTHGSAMAQPFSSGYALPPGCTTAASCLMMQPYSAGSQMTQNMPYYGGISSSYATSYGGQSYRGSSGGSCCGGCGASSCEPNIQIQQVPYPVPVGVPVPQPPLIIVKKIIPPMVTPLPPPITTTEVTVKETVMDPVTTVIDPLVVSGEHSARWMQPMSSCMPNGGQVGRINSMLAEALVDHSLPDEYQVMHVSRSVGEQIQYRVGLRATGGGCRTYELMSPFGQRSWSVGEIVPTGCTSMDTLDIPRCAVGIFGN